MKPVANLTTSTEMGEKMEHSQLKRLVSDAFEKYNTNEKHSIISIPFDEFPKETSLVAIGLILSTLMNNQGIEYQMYLCYNDKKIIIVKEVKNSMEIVFEIPYGERKSFLHLIYNINKILDADGNLTLFVNNSPYSLQSVVAIQTSSSQKYDEIIKILEKTDCDVIRNKSFDTLMKECEYRKWNVVSFPQKIEASEFENMFETPFIFGDKETLETAGYYNKNIFTPKVFISYCHNEADIVNKVVKRLKSENVNVWIDTQDLCSGVNLTRELLENIKQSDVAVSFVSHSMKSSNYAQFELENIMSEMCKKENKWSFIKLDDVNPNEVFPCLCNYFYIQYHDENDIEKIVDDIMKKIK